MRIWNNLPSFCGLFQSHDICLQPLLDLPSPFLFCLHIFIIFEFTRFAFATLIYFLANIRSLAGAVVFCLPPSVFIPCLIFLHRQRQTDILDCPNRTLGLRNVPLSITIFLECLVDRLN